jgi:hypothetical protein
MLTTPYVFCEDERIAMAEPAPTSSSAIWG